MEQLSRDPFDASDRAHSHLIKIMMPQPPACFPTEIFAGRGDCLGPGIVGAGVSGQERAATASGRNEMRIKQGEFTARVLLNVSWRTAGHCLPEIRHQSYGVCFLGGFWPHFERLFIVPFKSFRFVTHNAFERQWHEHQNHQHYLHSHTEHGLRSTEYKIPTTESGTSDEALMWVSVHRETSS